MDHLHMCKNVIEVSSFKEMNIPLNHLYQADLYQLWKTLRHGFCSICVSYEWRTVSHI